MLFKTEIIKSGIPRVVLFLLGVIIAGLIIRMNYIYEDIPLVLDSFRYFLLGIDISILGNFPDDYNKTNSGWSLFLALIFQSSDSSNYLDYMMIQRISSVIFSVITAVPLYFLSQKFFRKEIAMVGVCFFIFSPFMIENSILGITDSLFIFLLTSFLAMFFSKKKIIIMASFIVLGFSTIVRYESLLLIFPSVIIFLYRYRDNKDFQKYVIVGVVLFLLVITPISIWKTQMGIPDGIFSHLSGSVSTAINENSVNSTSDDRVDFLRGIVNLPKFLAMSLLPIIFIFVPYGIIPLLKKQNNNFKHLVLFGIILCIPAFYAYCRGYEEIRYMLFISPILIIASLFLIERLNEKIKKNNLLLIGLMLLIVISSIIYLDFRKMDYEYEIASVEVARFVSDLSGKINGYGPEIYYLEVMYLEDNKFPILSSEINFEKKIMYPQGETINEIIQDSKEKGLSYLAVTAAGQNSNQILSKVYHEEENYPYLQKIYDSKDDGLKFNIKIFEINYDEFELVSNSDLL
tara:strand:+ start:71 stop:1621 length:1551 start_codon:yes stop_codon:yes gene_type:complete